jgi:hypothetical protein
MTEVGMALSNPLEGVRRKGTVGCPLPDVVSERRMGVRGGWEGRERRRGGRRGGDGRVGGRGGGGGERRRGGEGEVERRWRGVGREGGVFSLITFVQLLFLRFDVFFHYFSFFHCAVGVQDCG